MHASELKKKESKILIYESKNNESHFYIEVQASEIVSYENKITGYIKDNSGESQFIINTNGWDKTTTEIHNTLKESAKANEPITIYGEHERGWINVSFFYVILNGEKRYFV